MNGEDIKIVVRQESQGAAVRETKRELDGVADSGNRAAEAIRKVGAAQRKINPLTGREDTPEDKAAARRDRQKQNAEAAKVMKGPPASPADQRKAEMVDLRRQIAAMETKLATAQAEGKSPEEQADYARRLRSNRLAYRFMREQPGLSKDDAFVKADTLVEAQTAAKNRETAEKTLAKTRIQSEKAATKEMQEQERVAKRITARFGALAGGAAVAIGGELLTDYFERQGMAARDTGARQVTRHQQQVIGWRGSSGQAQQKAWDAQDRLVELKAKDAEVENAAKAGIWETAKTRALQFGAGGAAIGSFGAGIGAIPGALIGGGIGLAEGAWEGWMRGKRAKDEHEKAKQRTASEGSDFQAQARKQALEQEAALEVDAIRQRSKRTVEGIRAAAADEMTISGMQKFRKLQAAGVDNDTAKEAAILETQNELREHQQRAAAGLVDARSGAAEIAAAASWAGRVTPSEVGITDKLGGKLDQLIKTQRDSMIQDGIEPFGKL